MSSLMEQGLERSAQMYLKQSKGGKFGRVPVFECLEEGVEVTIFNEGTGYSGEEKYMISYEEFNQYLQEGIPKEVSEVSWDEISQTNQKGNYNVLLSPHTVGWTKGKTFNTTEKIGGGGFPTIESITYEGKHVPILTDYGSIYEIELEWELNPKDTSEATLKEIRKFTGMFYPKRKDTDYIKVLYLEKYLKSALKAKPLTYQSYRSGGLEKYITHMSVYNHKKPFLDELKQSRKEKRGIDWGKV